MVSDVSENRTDRELLTEYASTGSESAFSEILRRHSGMVFNVCLRYLKDTHAAEDAAQAVFLILLKKSKKLSLNIILGRWLYKTARFTSMTMARNRKRAAEHEGKAGQMKYSETDRDTPSWEQVRPHIDKAMESLTNAQRDVIVLRYLEQRSEQNVCRELNWSRSRVSVTLTRALASLRKKLGKQGVTVSSAALGIFLSQNAAEAAPAKLVSSIHSTSIGNKAPSSASEELSNVVIKSLTMMKVKLISGILAVTVFAGIGAAAVTRLTSDKTPPATSTEPEITTVSLTGSEHFILNTKSFWRCFVVRGSELVRKASGGLAYLYELNPSERVRVRKKSVMKLVELDKPEYTPLPASGWMKPDFDDSAWIRSKGPFYLTKTKPTVNAYRQLSMICLRGTFSVPDPAKADGLRLSLSFQGGAVIYLNGREMTRKYMPAGKNSIDTPAEDYPEEAFVRPDGYVLDNARDSKAFPERFAKRVRCIEKYPIPRSMLRRGVNILAIEVHRSPAPEVMFTGKAKKGLRRYCWWPRISVQKIELTVPAKATVIPNIKRPKGFQVWNSNLLSPVYSGKYGDPNERIRPINICGVCNGVFSGQIVVSSTENIEGLNVSATDLTGPGIIPSSAVQVRYAVTGGRQQNWFDILEDSPPEQVAVDTKYGVAIQPVWFSVKVPRNAQAGDYKGNATVSVSGSEPIHVPIHLKAIGWRLPDPQDFATHVGLVQSPDSVAMRYSAAMWSKEHWKLLEKTFQLLGELGTDVVYIPMLRHTHFGNEHSMVRWTKGPNGTLKPDFSIAEKYLDLAVKHLGKVPVVTLYCWEPLRKLGDSPHGPGSLDRKILISITDPATGNLDSAEGPAWGTPECRAFWTEAFAGMKEVLEKRGLAESMMIGIFTDFPPSKEAAQDLAAAAPDAKWVVQTHGVRSSILGHSVGYATTPRRGISGLVDPALRGKRAYGWRDCPFIFAKCPRGELKEWAPLPAYYSYAETWIAAIGRGGRGSCGFGRIGADFWRVMKDNKGGSLIVNRFASDSTWGTLTLGYQAPLAILGAGIKGPIATVRSEVLRQGLQEAEARIFLEKALTDETKKVKIGKELADRCQGLLDERVRNILRAGGRMEHHDTVDWFWFVSSGWQKRAQELYSAAAEVADKLK